MAAAISVPRAAAQAPAPDRALEATVLYGVNRDLSIADAAAQLLVDAGLADVRIDSEPTQWNLGINIAGNPVKFLMIQTELLYNDLGESRVSALVTPRTRASVNLRGKMFEWTAGARLQVPAGSWRVQPHFGASVGVTRLTSEVDTPGFSSEDDFTDVVYHFGIGTRLFFTRSFGVAPEFRFVRLPDVNFQRVLVGAVFRVE